MPPFADSRSARSMPAVRGRAPTSSATFAPSKAAVASSKMSTPASSGKAQSSSSSATPAAALSPCVTSRRRSRTGVSAPSSWPEAMRNSSAYPIWPAAPVTVTLTGVVMRDLLRSVVLTSLSLSLSLSLCLSLSLSLCPRPDAGAPERSCQAGGEVLVECGEEGLGRQPRGVGPDEEREVLGHLAALDRRDDDVLERLGKPRDLGRPVQLAAVLEPAGPREDRRDRVRRRRPARLVLAVVPRHGAVRRLGLDRRAVGGHQDARHETERAEPLRDGVGLDVAVVVLAGPHVPALPLHRRSNHVVDEAVLVRQPGSGELGGELGVEHLLEDVLECAVVRLEDRVLGRQVDRVAA